MIGNEIPQLGRQMALAPSPEHPGAGAHGPELSGSRAGGENSILSVGEKCYRGRYTDWGEIVARERGVCALLCSLDFPALLKDPPPGAPLSSHNIWLAGSCPFQLPAPRCQGNPLLPCAFAASLLEA